MNNIHDFINRKIEQIRKLKNRDIRILSVINLITILKFVGVSLNKEQLLTIENGLFIIFDLFVSALFGADLFKLQRENKYLNIISVAIKSDDSFTIPGNEEDFNNNLNERSKRYFKAHKKKGVDINNIF